MIDFRMVEMAALIEMYLGLQVQGPYTHSQHRLFEFPLGFLQRVLHAVLSVYLEHKIIAVRLIGPCEPHRVVMMHWATP